MLQEYYRELPYTLQRETHSDFMRRFFCRERIRSRMAGRIHFPIISSLLQPGSILQSFLDFNGLEAFRRAQASHFVVCLSIWVYMMFLVIRPRWCILGLAHHRGGAAFSSFHFLRPPWCRFVLLLVVVTWVTYVGLPALSTTKLPFPFIISDWFSGEILWK